MARKPRKRPSAAEVESMLREMLPALPGAGDWAIRPSTQPVDADATTLTLLDQIPAVDEAPGETLVFPMSSDDEE